MLLNEVWPEDYVELEEVSRLGRMAMAGALGAGLLGGAAGVGKMMGKSAQPSSPSVQQPITQPPLPPTSAAQPAPATPQAAQPTAQAQPSAPQRNNAVVQGRVPHSGFPAELHGQPSADRNERIRSFVSVLRPLVARANSAILADRERLQRIGSRGPDRASNDDVEWVRDLATRYRVRTTLQNGQEKPFSTTVSDLLRRVDAIPEHLVLAQAALESGWGTSELSRQANNMFGQKATHRHPDAYRIRNTDGLDYRQYDHPAHSVSSYMHNLNSHPSYEDFRRTRAQLRRQQNATPLSMSRTLTNHLTAYSTSPVYGERLRSVIGSIAAAR